MQADACNQGGKQGEKKRRTEKEDERTRGQQRQGNGNDGHTLRDLLVMRRSARASSWL